MSGAQWFAIFSASSGDLVSVGSAVTFPLNPGLRAVTVDGEQNGRFWDKVTLNFVAAPPPPPPPPAKVICDPTCDCRKHDNPPPPPPPVADRYPYAEEWVQGDLVFTGKNGAALEVKFTSGRFAEAPLIDGITVNSQTVTSSAYLRFSTGNITKDGFLLWAKAEVPINYTVPVVIHAVQRTKEKA